MKTQENALVSGTRLEEYEIKKVLGAGGFGITYLAYDVNLLMEVVIKEYLPNYLAIRKDGDTIVPISKGDKEEYEWGMKRFLEEAQTLASFKPRHPNIVKVIRFFKKNGTAYFVMEHEDGEDLSTYLKNRSKKLSEDDIKSIILPILDGLRETHKKNILHRDIKPSNIFIRKNGEPLLIDFGSARHAVGGKTKSLSVVVTAGYAPIEQYSSTAKQGAFTDIYSLGAVMYKLATGITPIESNDRSMSVYTNGEEDLLISAVKQAKGKYSYGFLQAIDKALSIRPQDRPQKASIFKSLLVDEEKTIKENFEEKIQKVKINKTKTIKIVAIVAILFLIAFLSFFAFDNDDINSHVEVKHKQAQIDREKKEKEKQEQERIKKEKLKKEKLKKEKIAKENAIKEKAIKENNTTEDKNMTSDINKTKIINVATELDMFDVIDETQENKEDGLEDALKKKVHKKENKVVSSDFSLCEKYYGMQKGVKYCKRACDKNYAASCNNLGIMYDDGKGVKKNTKKASSFYAKACNLGKAIACSNLGYLYDNGYGVTENKHKAFKLYMQSCNVNIGIGCNNVAWLYESGGGVRKDIKKSFFYYKKSCNLNSALGCCNLGNAYKNGFWVKRDSKKALKYYKKSCNLGFKDGCKEYENMKSSKSFIDRISPF